MKVKVYYAHSIGIYNKPQESKDVELLQALGFEVVNPNAPEHDAGYKAGGMGYFDGLVVECGALAFRAHADGSIPAGVMHEINYARSNGIPVFELPAAIERRTLTVEQTRAYLRESGAR